MRLKGEFILFGGIIWIILAGFLITSYPVPKNIEVVDTLICQSKCVESLVCPVQDQCNYDTQITQSDLDSCLVSCIDSTSQEVNPIDNPSDSLPIKNPCIG